MSDTLLHETKIHGTIDFPYIVYHGKIPDFIHSYPLHWHDEAEIIYVTRGYVKITVWSKTYHVQEGDIVILMPHVIHSIEILLRKKVIFMNPLYVGIDVSSKSNVVYLMLPNGDKHSNSRLLSVVICCTANSCNNCILSA